MPYKNLQELPENVRHVLPEHAQKIYLEAFNHACEEYKDPKTRNQPEENLEEVAHKVAWAAVKQKYEKDKKTNKWVPKKDHISKKENRVLN